MMEDYGGLFLLIVYIFVGMIDSCQNPPEVRQRRSLAFKNAQVAELHLCTKKGLGKPAWVECGQYEPLFLPTLFSIPEHCFACVEGDVAHLIPPPKCNTRNLFGDCVFELTLPSGKTKGDNDV